MKNKTLLFICAMWLAIACKPHTPPPAPEDPPSQAIPAPTDPPTQESISPPSAETNPPTRSAPSDSANQEETLLNQESVLPSSPEPEIIPPAHSAPSDSANQEETLLNQESVLPSSQEPEIIPESTSPAQTTNPLQTPESQPIPRMPDTNPPAPESAPQVVAPPTAPAPQPAPITSDTNPPAPESVPQVVAPPTAPAPQPIPITPETNPPASESAPQVVAPPTAPAPQPAPITPETNPPAPESAPQVVAPPTAPAPQPRPTPIIPIAVSIKDPFLLPAVYDKIRRLERPKTSIALSYMLIPTSKLASFRANPQRFAPTLSTWRRGGIFGATNFLNISRSHSNIRGSNSNYFLQNSKVPSDYFYRSHLRLIRFDFTNRNAPTLSYKHFYSANDINNVTDAPLRRASFEKSFDEPWSLQDSDVRYLNEAFPHLAVHAGETFHLLLLLSFHEPSTKLAPYYFYDHPVNLDNLDQFVYTMQD